MTHNIGIEFHGSLNGFDFCKFGAWLLQPHYFKFMLTFAPSMNQHFNVFNESKKAENLPRNTPVALLYEQF